AACFLSADLVEGLVHFGDDMEAVEDMQGLGAFFPDDLEIGLPHVRADEHDFGNDFLAHRREESLEGFDGPFLADPKEASDADVDLINQRQVLVAFGVLDFIYANGVDLTERAVLQSPGDHMFDRIEYLVPGSAKALCGFFPRKPARPTS